MSGADAIAMVDQRNTNTAAIINARRISGKRELFGGPSTQAPKMLSKASRQGRAAIARGASETALAISRAAADLFGKANNVSSSGGRLRSATMKHGRA